MKKRIQFAILISFILLVSLNIGIVIFGVGYNKREREVWNKKLLDYQEQVDNDLEKQISMEKLVNEKNLELEDMKKLLNDIKSENKSLKDLLNEMNSKNKSLEDLLNEINSKNKSLEKLLNEKD